MFIRIERLLAPALTRVCGLAGWLAVASTPLGPAAAGDIISTDPWEVIHAVRAFGPADVVKDDFRDPRIDAVLERDAGGPGGLPYTLTFHGCDMGRNCTSILLALRLRHASWAEKPPSDAVLAAWNARKLVGRAWLDAENGAVLDHAVVMGAGLPRDTLTATLDLWKTAMREFMEHVDFPGK